MKRGVRNLKLDADEREILDAYEGGKLKPIATKAEMERLRAAARETLRRLAAEGIPTPKPRAPAPKRKRA